MGVGDSDPAINPFLGARLPTLRSLLGGGVPTLDRAASAPTTEAGGRVVHLLPLDATLEVEGLPQSGTGQATLLTGQNCAVLHGHHFGPWVPVGLRPLVQDESWLRRAADGGLRLAFANAYPADWPGTGPGRRRVAGPPLAAQAAGLLTRHVDALARKQAVASEIVNTGWRRWLGETTAPRITPEVAGGVLATITAAHDLTFFAHYSTDTAGHRGGMEGAVAALERVDRFLDGLLAALPTGTTLLVVSDHGNIEDVRGGHTRNPALGLVVDPPGERPSWRSLADVAPGLLGWFGLPR